MHNNTALLLDQNFTVSELVVGSNGKIVIMLHYWIGWKNWENHSRFILSEFVIGYGEQDGKHASVPVPYYSLPQIKKIC